MPRRALQYVVWTVVLVAGLAAGVAAHQLWELRAEVERLAHRLSLDAGPESTLIYDASNNLVSALFDEHRIAVPLSEMSPHLVRSVLVIEDRRFYEHAGIDFRRIVKAAVENHRAGEIVQGGSTITQQLVRSILLDRSKTYRRKLKEALLARRLEERHSKDEILQAYLNRVYFGDGYYGVQAAAIGYFGKPVSALDPAEAALLAGLIKGPSLYSPTRAPDRARERRDLVLSEMRAEGVLAETDYARAVSTPIAMQLARHETAVPDPRRIRGAEYFIDVVQRELQQRFGAEAVYTGGLRVYTTLDRRLQSLAEDAVVARARRVPRTGAEALQGALVAIEPGTGFVKAIVGGRDFGESPFNRAMDARRQPGSAFKPFIFAQALESGFSPSTRIEGLDEPIQTQHGPWLPDGEHERSSVRLREALVVSSNRAAAHLLQQVGVRRTLDLVSRFGITADLPAVPSLALGTGEMSLYELTSAYTVFANKGRWRAPTTIRRVEDRYGREIHRAPDRERPVISEATAYLMTSMMADVLTRGTASTARGAGFTLRAAGKTGTSSDYTDAWFVGYTPHLVTGVWFGYDTPRTIMSRGFASVVAVPAWARFMGAATRGAADDWFTMPGSLVPVKLCRISGLLATDRCHLPVLEYADHDSPHADARFASMPELTPGGVYEELRQIGREPETCPLHHQQLEAIRASYETPAFSPAIPRPAPPADPIVEPAGDPPAPPHAFVRVPTSAPAPPPPPSVPAERSTRPAAIEENPVVPGTPIVRTPAAPPPPPAPAPVIPGSPITRTPPPPPPPPPREL